MQVAPLVSRRKQKRLGVVVVVVNWSWAGMRTQAPGVAPVAVVRLSAWVAELREERHLVEARCR